MLNKMSILKNKLSSHTFSPPSAYSLPFPIGCALISRHIQMCSTNRRNLSQPTPNSLCSCGGKPRLQCIVSSSTESQTHYSRPGRVQLVTSWLGTGKPLTFFTVYSQLKHRVPNTPRFLCEYSLWLAMDDLQVNSLKLRPVIYFLPDASKGAILQFQDLWLSARILDLCWL